MDEEEKEQQTSEQKKEGTKSELGMVRRWLYSRSKSEEVEEREAELRSLGIDKNERERLEEESDTLAVTRYKNMALIRAKRLVRFLRFSGIMLFSIAMIVLVVALTLWYRRAWTVSEDQVYVEISAPEEFVSGEEIAYRVGYKNESRVDWEDVEIVFTAPRGFTYKESAEQIESSGKQIVWKKGDLKSQEGGEIEIKGTLIGEQNEAAVAKAELFLTPENFPSGRFSKLSFLATTISSSPLELALNFPRDVANGERAVAGIRVENLANNDLEGIYLRIAPVAGVELATRDSEFTPGFSKVDFRWDIGMLESFSGKDFEAVFYVEGSPGEKRVLDIEVGIVQDGEKYVQRLLSHVVNVSASEIVVDQYYNGSKDEVTVQAGQEVSGEVKYKNVGTVGLRGVIVEVKFDGEGFDPSTLDLKGGAYDSEKKVAYWSGATVPELKVLQPQQEGSIKFGFKVRGVEDFLKLGEAAKNQIIISTALVDSPDLPMPQGQPHKVVSDRSVLSVGTELLFTIDAFYDDGRLGLTSVGPLPPRVGETTVYTVRFRAGTKLNDVGDVRVKAVLPDGVTHTGQLYKTGGEVRFDDRTGHLEWTVPFIEGLKGSLSPPEELHFQIAIKPGENQRGSVVKLLSGASLEAVDQFTDEALQATTEGLDTGMVESGKGEVE